MALTKEPEEMRWVRLQEEERIDYSEDWEEFRRKYTEPNWDELASITMSPYAEWGRRMKSEEAKSSMKKEKIKEIKCPKCGYKKFVEEHIVTLGENQGVIVVLDKNPVTYYCASCDAKLEFDK